MKVIATILVDLERTVLGTRSRLRDELAGRPVRRRTVERGLQARRVDAVHLLAPADQSAEVARQIKGLDVKIESVAAGTSPSAALVRAGRVWGLDGWRGGIGSLCAFDEDLLVAPAAAAARQAAADAVLSVPAGAAVVDPELINGAVEHWKIVGETAHMTFVQAPPGLAGAIFDRLLLEDLAKTGHPPGLLLTYHPNHPAPDPAGREPCYRAPAEAIEARGRLICDTRRSFDRVRDLLEAGGESWGAAQVGRWLAERGRRHVDEVPEEIEVELTTEVAVGVRSILRPGGEAVGRRGPIDLRIIRRIAESIEGWDDVRIVLGGFGEPCLHPEFAEVCRILRDAGAMSLAVRTSALVGDLAVEDTLFKTPVDVVEVTLDAVTAETYRRVHGLDAFGQASERLERWLARRASEQVVTPLILPSLCKADETLEEMEAFVDRWQSRLGMYLVLGYSHRAGQLDRRAVTSTAPPRRETCRRSFARTLVLADGRLTTCDQDFAGRQTVGDLSETPLRELWRSERMAALRQSTIGDLPLCPACEEWHRP